MHTDIQDPAPRFDREEHPGSLFRRSLDTPTTITFASSQHSQPRATLSTGHHPPSAATFFPFTSSASQRPVLQQSIQPQPYPSRHPPVFRLSQPNQPAGQMRQVPQLGGFTSARQQFTPSSTGNSSHSRPTGWDRQLGGQTTGQNTDLGSHHNQDEFDDEFGDGSELVGLESKGVHLIERHKIM